MSNRIRDAEYAVTYGAGRQERGWFLHVMGHILRAHRRQNTPVLF